VHDYIIRAPAVPTDTTVDCQKEIPNISNTANKERRCMGLRGRSIFGDTGQVFFVTTSTVHHNKVFGLSREYYNILAESLKFVLNEYRAKLFGYVFMPSHVHLILAMPEGESISDLMRDFKKYTSTKVRQQLEKEGRYSALESLRVNAQRRKNQVFKLWMDRFDDLVIDQEETLSVKLEYIHNNPVKAGFVEEAEEWEFSSARNYSFGDHIFDVATDWKME
jgi:putative transposase